jgi:hypothetical protein
MENLAKIQIKHILGFNELDKTAILYAKDGAEEKLDD